MLPLGLALALTAAAPLPALDDAFPVRGALAGGATLHRGPDASTPAVAVAPPGTPLAVAVASAGVGRFVRVRLADGRTAFAERDAVELGAAAEVAWSAAASPPPPQAPPAVDAAFPARGVLTAEAELRQGPDASAFSIASAPAGTLVAIAAAPVGRFVRVRLANGVSGFVPTAAVERGAEVEVAWAAPAVVAPPRPVVDPRLAPDHGRKPRRHDGLLARVEVGVGRLSAASGVPSGGLTGARLHGGAALVAVTVAQPLREGLLLGGQVWLARAGGATNDGEIDGELPPGVTVDPEGAFTQFGFAPVLVFYAREPNLHLSLAPGFSRVRVKAQAPLNVYGREGDGWSPGWGFSVRIAAGWEYWVTDALAVGPAASIGLGTIRDTAWSDASWKTSTWSLGLSATWN